MANISIFTDIQTLSQAVANLFIDNAILTIETKGRFSVALAGGSTPQESYELLASEKYSKLINWSQVYIFWGDERCVPPDHIESNYYMAWEAFLKYLPIPTTNIYRMEGERDPWEAAQRYQDKLMDFFGEIPRFDLILLGMGNDGHTASLFPGTKALFDSKVMVTANYIEKLSSWRITLTPLAINQASRIAFIVSGENKASTLNKVIHGKYKPDIYPSQLIKPVHGKLNWYIDKNAATHLHE